MNQSLKNQLNDSKSVLILLPKNPGLDQVAASLALFLSLKDQKEVSISCPTPMLAEFNRLVGVNKITTELGSKNLVIKFKNYVPENIDKVSYDVENNEFRLSVAPKANTPAPTKDQVDLTYGGVSADTVILIGGASDVHFPALTTPELKSAKVIHIGNTGINLPDTIKFMSLARPASSISEVVSAHIKELKDGYDVDTATNLLAGLYKGSKNFAHPDTKSDTFKIASELMNAGAKIMPQEKLPTPPPPLPQRPMPAPQTQRQNPPKSWLQPKVYKGTSVS